MTIPDIIIAIDGYSSTGKSSFAKIIANEFSFLYLDSGALYRGVTLFAIENGFIADDNAIDVPALTLAMEDLDLHFGEEGTYIGNRCIEKEIRGMAVAGKVSPIATVPQVRSFVDRKLREFGRMKGRNGWKGYRNYRISGCGTEDIHDSGSADQGSEEG